MQIQTITTATIPGYRIYEYLLVISPHKELWGKIMEVKMKFADKYESEHARLGKPQVMLANFVQYEMMQERLVNRLRIVAMGATPFKLELRDFGSFPSHTIYINIVTKVQVQNLVKAIRHEAQKLMKLNDENKPHFILEPYITVGRKLQAWQNHSGPLGGRDPWAYLGLPKPSDPYILLPSPNTRPCSQRLFLGGRCQSRLPNGLQLGQK